MRRRRPGRATSGTAGRTAPPPGWCSSSAQLDVEDLARLRRRPRRQLALGVEAVVEAVGQRGAADVTVDAVEFDDLIDVVDRRGAHDRQHRLDRMLEFLRVAALRRVPHLVEHRPDDLRLDRVERPVQAGVDDLARRHRRIAGRLIAARVVGVAPADRRVHREPLPLLERVADLRREIEAAQAGVVGDDQRLAGAVEHQIAIAVAGRALVARSVLRYSAPAEK